MFVIFIYRAIWIYIFLIWYSLKLPLRSRHTHAVLHQPSDCFEYFKKKPTPTSLNQGTPKNSGEIFLPHKITGINGFGRHFQFLFKKRWPSSPATCILRPWSAPGEEEDMAPFSQEIHKSSTKTTGNPGSVIVPQYVSSKI